jgi:hypothetical protein
MVGKKWMTLGLPRPHLFFFFLVLGFELKAFHFLGRHSTT